VASAHYDRWVQWLPVHFKEAKILSLRTVKLGGSLTWPRACRDGSDGKKHGRGLSVQSPLDHTGERHESEGLIEPDRFRLRVGHDDDAAKLASLFEREMKHMPDERFADSESLCALVYAEASQAYHRQRIRGQAFPEARVRQPLQLHAANRDGGEAKDLLASNGRIGHREVELELVSPGVVLKELDGGGTQPRGLRDGLPVEERGSSETADGAERLGNRVSRPRN